MKGEETIEEAEKQITEEQRTVDYEVHEYPIEVIVQKYVDGLEYNTSDMRWFNFSRGKTLGKMSG